jgi:hypothetical protein
MPTIEINKNDGIRNNLNEIDNNAHSINKPINISSNNLRASNSYQDQVIKIDKYVDKISQFIIDSVPENKILMSMVAPGFTGSGSVNSGFVRSVITDPKERKRSQQDIVNMINKNAPSFSEGKIYSCPTPIRETIA